MKKLLVVGGLLVVLGAGQAEASQVSNGLGKAWGYLTAPVNCLLVLGKGLVSAAVDTATCVLNNINPKNLIP